MAPGPREERAATIVLLAAPIVLVGALFLHWRVALTLPFTAPGQSLPPSPRPQTAWAAVPVASALLTLVAAGAFALGVRAMRGQVQAGPAAVITLTAAGAAIYCAVRLSAPSIDLSNVFLPGTLRGSSFALPRIDHGAGVKVAMGAAALAAAAALVLALRASLAR